MKRTRLISLVVLFVLLSVGTTAWALRRSEEEGCQRSRTGFATSSPVSAVSNNRLVVLDGDSEMTAARVDDCLRALVAPTDAVLRHVDTRRRVGTTFVLDSDGDDRIVLLGRAGTHLLQTAGEALHPTWSPDGVLAWSEDFDTLKVMSADLAEVEEIRLPGGAAGVFSPEFTSDGDLITVIQEPVRGLPIEDDALNNLWRYSTDEARWQQLTYFKATAESWSIIRTPVVSDDGTVTFVRITGAASATRAPAFELWRWDGAEASRVKELPGETFLAGETDQGLLFNAQASRCADWGLFQGAGRSSEFLGCGAVSVEPTTMVDPDAEHEHEGEQAPEAGKSSGRDARLSIVLGDYSSRAAAERVMAQVATAGASLLNHKAAPSAVRPGAWIVAVPVTKGVDPQVELESFRKRFPSLAQGAFLTPLPNR